jgi:hypothetical protein
VTPKTDQERWAEAERTGRCGTCGKPTHATVGDGCTPYTCTHPCAICGHIGDVHRDWYQPGFCRRCPEGEPHRHNYQPA